MYKTDFELRITREGSAIEEVRQVTIHGVEVPPDAVGSDPVDQLVFSLVEVITSGEPCTHTYRILNIEPKTLDWKCYEQVGSPIYPAPLALQTIKSTDELLEACKGTELTQRDALIDKEGRLVVVPTMFGYGLAELQRDGEHGPFHAVSQESGTVFILKFAMDGALGKECWMCVGSGNLKAIQKIEMEVPGE